jgi:DNA-directed RNA polymerase specialized sigma24 family protein
MLAWAIRAGVSQSDAVELVGEVFARAWISRRRYRDPGDGSATPWLFGIARNVVADGRRRAAIDARARRRLGMQTGSPADELFGRSQSVRERERIGSGTADHD